MSNAMITLIWTALVANVVFVAFSEAAVASLGRCPNLRGIPNFRRDQYIGVWYEYSNVFEFFQIGSKCVRATYTDLGSEIGVFNEQVNTITGNYGNVKGTAKQIGNLAEFAVGFSSIPFAGNENPTAANYRVLETDYTSYAIVYNCNEFLFFKKESLWFLSREQNPSASLVSTVYSKMRQLGVPVNSLEKTDQTGCSKLPAPGTASSSTTIESFGK